MKHWDVKTDSMWDLRGNDAPEVRASFCAGCWNLNELWIYRSASWSSGECSFFHFVWCKIKRWGMEHETWEINYTKHLSVVSEDFGLITPKALHSRPGWENPRLGERSFYVKLTLPANRMSRLRGGRRGDATVRRTASRETRLCIFGPVNSGHLRLSPRRLFELGPVCLLRSVWQKSFNRSRFDILFRPTSSQRGACFFCSLLSHDCFSTLSCPAIMTSGNGWECLYDSWQILLSEIKPVTWECESQRLVQELV